MRRGRGHQGGRTNWRGMKPFLYLLLEICKISQHSSPSAIAFPSCWIFRQNPPKICTQQTFIGLMQYGQYLHYASTGMMMTTSNGWKRPGIAMELLGSSVAKQAILEYSQITHQQNSIRIHLNRYCPSYLGFLSFSSGSTVRFVDCWARRSG